LALAGLWDSWKGSPADVLESCTIITTAANSRLADLHDRMPVILHHEDYDRWLDPAVDDAGLLQALLVPYPSEEMTFQPVSPFVNSPRNDGPKCLEPPA
jgi:putative SOS response-associated peptidase YedK